MAAPRLVLIFGICLALSALAYLPGIRGEILNFDDDPVLCQVFRELLEDEWPIISISADTGRNLDQLKQAVFDSLEILRVYSKAPGEEPDFSEPVVMKQGATLEDFAQEIHKDFLKKLKFARVWGSTAFDGQMVQRDYVLQDGDVVELRI